MKRHDERMLFGASFVGTAVLGTLLCGAPASASTGEEVSCVQGPDETTVVCCVTKTDYRLSSASVGLPFGGVPTFKDGPGGTISVSTSYNGTVSYEVTAGAEAEVSGVFAKAKASVSSSLMKTNSTITAHTFTRSIKAKMFGHVRYVSHGKKISWKKVRTNRNCSTSVLSSGSINFPTSEEGS
jgi:hypothetical protein